MDNTLVQGAHNDIQPSIIVILADGIEVSMNKEYQVLGVQEAVCIEEDACEHEFDEDEPYDDEGGFDNGDEIHDLGDSEHSNSPIDVFTDPEINSEDNETSTQPEEVGGDVDGNVKEKILACQNEHLEMDDGMPCCWSHYYKSIVNV